MKKIVINVRAGGFNLSGMAATRYLELLGKTRPENFYANDISRDDSNLVKVVEELGKKANGDSSKLKIAEIPDGIEWEIEEYDGIEWISEKHRTWSQKNEIDAVKALTTDK